MAEQRKTPMPGEHASQGNPYSAPLADNRKRERGEKGAAPGPGAGNRDRTDHGCAYTVKEESRRSLMKG